MWVASCVDMAGYFTQSLKGVSMLRSELINNIHIQVQELQNKNIVENDDLDFHCLFEILEDARSYFEELEGQ